MNKLLKYLDLYFTFFKIGLVTFGGGIAMLPILERELVTKKSWVTSDELIDYFAIGQSTPGIIAVNVSTFCGHKLFGVFGAIVATVGMVTPSVVIISLLAKTIKTFNQNEYVIKALKGINVAVAANLTYAFFNLIKKSIKNIVGIFIFVIAFCLVYFCKLPAYIIILLAITFGIISFYCTQRKK